MAESSDQHASSERQDQELINLRLTEEKLRQELNELRRPYIFRNSQLLTALITTVGAIIGVSMLISDNYFKIRDQLNVQQATETKRLNAEALKAKEEAAKSQTEADAAKAKAAETIKTATQQAKAANDLVVATQTHLDTLQARAESLELASQAEEAFARGDSKVAQKKAVASWLKARTPGAKKAVVDAYTFPVSEIIGQMHDIRCAKVCRFRQIVSRW